LEILSSDCPTFAAKNKKKLKEKYKIFGIVRATEKRSKRSKKKEKKRKKNDTSP